MNVLHRKWHIISGSQQKCFTREKTRKGKHKIFLSVHNAFKIVGSRKNVSKSWWEDVKTQAEHVETNTCWVDRQPRCLLSNLTGFSLAHHIPQCLPFNRNFILNFSHLYHNFHQLPKPQSKQLFVAEASLGDEFSATA
ncbi:CLUMA_CG011114, isoform A [Clunio marinus]|uniref:CLUMA_CG011114, isoform A n=1 Tax=Clunio marinus TaxID=568069 RepID=A0A1J1IFF7_9DIPT|nr:CLUMA_CG011114, isoform A [Clunio marinus]